MGVVVVVVGVWMLVLISAEPINRRSLLRHQLAAAGCLAVVVVEEGVCVRFKSLNSCGEMKPASVSWISVPVDKNWDVTNVESRCDKRDLEGGTSCVASTGEEEVVVVVEEVRSNA